MKKYILLIMICFLLTGCTIVRIDTKSIDNTINVVLSKDNQLYNRVGKGYKYYVPRGVTYIDTNELNDKLYSNGNYYYLYIDAISYYYNTDINYEINKSAYYSKDFVLNDKKGYLEITEKDGKKKIEFFYNYAKIIALVDEDDINDVVLNASYILSTIKFNNNIIKLMLNEDYFINKEEKYEEFTSKKETDNFLKTDIEINEEMLDEELTEETNNGE